MRVWFLGQAASWLQKNSGGSKLPLELIEFFFECRDPVIDPRRGEVDDLGLLSFCHWFLHVGRHHKERTDQTDCPPSGLVSPYLWQLVSPRRSIRLTTICAFEPSARPSFFTSSGINVTAGGYQLHG
jgi:hypothetical protein